MIEGDFYICLIDGHDLTQQGLRTALQNIEPSLHISAYRSVDEFVSNAPARVDLVLCYFREEEDPSFSTFTSLQQIFEGVPVLALSDRDDADPDAAKDLLRHGAQGFISTKLVNLDMVVAAIRFIKAGGSTVAPREAFLANSAQTVIPPQKQRRPRATRFDSKRKGRHTER